MKNFSKKHCKHESKTDLFKDDFYRYNDGKITDKELEAIHPCWKRSSQACYMRGKSMVNTIFFLIRGEVCDKYDFVKPHIYAVRLAVTGKIVYRYQPNRVRNSARNQSKGV